MQFRDHPSVKPHIEAEERMRAAINQAVVALDHIAANLPRGECPGKGQPCACSGACKNPAYEPLMNIALDLAKATRS